LGILNGYGGRMSLNPKMKCICRSKNFNKISKYSRLLEENVDYIECEDCGLIVASDSENYNLSKIYNESYFLDMDTGWKGRAELVLEFINFLNRGLNLKEMKMCDFGAGNGYLTKSLIDSGYTICAYEPFLGNNLYLDKMYYINEPFKADVLIMVEVFEHFTNSSKEIEEILIKFNYPKILIFTTQLTENAKGNIDDWWYLNPDAGHFTLWSKKSLVRLGELEGYNFVSFSDFMHILCKKQYKKEYEILKLKSVAYKLKSALSNRYIFLKNKIKTK
jgi:hypothetical protein